MRFIITELLNAENDTKRALFEAIDNADEKLKKFTNKPWFIRIFYPFPWEECHRVAELTTSLRKIQLEIDLLYLQSQEH